MKKSLRFSVFFYSVMFTSLIRSSFLVILTILFCFFSVTRDIKLQPEIVQKYIFCTKYFLTNYFDEIDIFVSLVACYFKQINLVVF